VRPFAGQVGELRSEQGVTKLVRFSPKRITNTERQTSMSED
jgi:protein subunit release factor B